MLDPKDEKLNVIYLKIFDSQKKYKFKIQKFKKYLKLKKFNWHKAKFKIKLKLI